MHNRLFLTRNGVMCMLLFKLVIPKVGVDFSDQYWVELVPPISCLWLYMYCTTIPIQAVFHLHECANITVSI